MDIATKHAPVSAPRCRLSAGRLLFILLLSLTLGAPLTAGAQPPPTPSPWADMEDLTNVALRRELAHNPLRIRSYTVEDGDTVSGIAHLFGLDVDTLRWSNPALENNPDYLRPGMELIILPVRGVYHQVRAGDTLESLATRYDVTVADIAGYPLNALRPGQPLPPGAWLVIPYGSKNLSRPRPALAPDSPFAWPIVGYVTQSYSADHPALDIGAPYGSAVYAARAGVVVRASWADTGYGYLVWIEHGDGYATVYSHLKGAWVSAGQRVARGQLIGEVGSTGNSTGPHVHFEVRVNGVRSDPTGYLPAQ